jgi:hypothetical protein
MHMSNWPLAGPFWTFGLQHSPMLKTLVVYESTKEQWKKGELSLELNPKSRSTFLKKNASQVFGEGICDVVFTCNCLDGYLLLFDSISDEVIFWVNVFRVLVEYLVLRHVNGTVVVVTDGNS